jgi:hypothetical protein
MKMNPLIYLYSSIIMATIPIIIHSINMNKYKVFNPSPEMKKELFVKDSNYITNFDDYTCFPKNKNCYEIVNNIKFNIAGIKHCTLVDWKTVNDNKCNIYNFFEKFIMIFVIFINVFKLFSSCKFHYFEINNFADIKNIDYISFLINFSVIYDIIINIYTFFSGYNSVFFVGLLLEFIFMPTIFFVFELHKNIRCCKIKKFKLRYTIRIVPINTNITNTQSVVDISNICLVCYNNKRNILFTPCNHLCCCSECSELSLINCPYCRVPIENKVNIFIP